MVVNSKIPVVGLIGGVGSGKSSVARRLSERNCVAVIDGDKLGHQILENNNVKQQLKAEFGTSIFDEHGDVVRSALASLVFGADARHRDVRSRLEQIVHPEIRRRIVEEVDTLRKANTVDVIVLDAAVLFEAGWNDLCSAVVFVETPWEQRCSRVAATRGWTEEQLKSREASQMPLAEKQRLANYSIQNGLSLDLAVSQLEEILKQLA